MEEEVSQLWVFGQRAMELRKIASSSSGAQWAGLGEFRRYLTKKKKKNKLSHFDIFLYIHFDVLIPKCPLMKLKMKKLTKYNGNFS